MKTYLATTCQGDTKHISAYTQSDAYQQASDWAMDKGGLSGFDEV